MASIDLVNRLAALSSLSNVPRNELEWLVKHGNLEVFEIGTVVSPKGKRIDKLMIVLAGHIAIRVDRGAGPRQVMEWRTGDVTGVLPYSRMTESPGNTRVEEKAEALGIHEDHFPDMIHLCPVFTAHTVHIMLDRARSFNTSDLQDEKLISLGKLASGLAHELNNPAAATLSSAKLLFGNLAKANAALRALGSAGLTDEVVDQIERILSSCLAKPGSSVLTPIQQADRESEFSDWLECHNADSSYAAPLAETTITIDALDELSKRISGEMLTPAIGWIATACTTHLLATDIERAATRIHQLVTAVKKFTYMDKLAGPEYVDVESGLQDTVRVLASKAKTKRASITLNIEANLPRVQASGGELNQVWMNLIDNALDAISDAGNIDISVRKELNQVVISVVDDGPGIPSDVMPHIFDPFFTTKPPGQGTGLGLEITRRLVRRFHGDISVESRPDRTEFRVCLLEEKPAPAELGKPHEGRGKK